jgi:hypothetical protein
MLGLKRRPKPVPSLEDYLASRKNNDGQPEDADCEVPVDEQSDRAAMTAASAKRDSDERSKAALE